MFFSIALGDEKEKRSLDVAFLEHGYFLARKFLEFGSVSLTSL